MKRRLFSRILAFILIFSLLPVNAFASSLETTEYLEDDESVDDDFDWGEDDESISPSEETDSAVETDNEEVTESESSTDMINTITSETTDDVLVLNTGDYSDDGDDGDVYTEENDDSESSLLSTLASVFSLGESRATSNITLKTGGKIYSASDLANLGKVFFKYKYTTINGDNRTVYCLNKSKKNYAGGVHVPGSSLSTKQQKLTSWAIKYGYHSNTKWSNMTNAQKSKYGVTQIMIWLIEKEVLSYSGTSLKGESKATTTLKKVASAMKSPTTATNCYKAMLTGIENELKNKANPIPSFMKTSASSAKSNAKLMSYNESTDNYELTYTDKNGVLTSDNVVCNSSYFNVEVNDNKHSIKITISKEDAEYLMEKEGTDVDEELNPRRIIFTGTKTDYDVSVWEAKGYEDTKQKLATFVADSSNIKGYLYMTLKLDNTYTRFQVTKIDKETGTKLTDAEFILQYYNTSSSVWEDAVTTNGDKYELEDLTNTGVYHLWISDLEEKFPSSQYSDSTQFRIKETLAPNGYSNAENDLWASTPVTLAQMKEAESSFSFTAPNKRNSIQFGVKKVSRVEYKKLYSDILAAAGFNIDWDDESLYVEDPITGSAPIDDYIEAFEAQYGSSYTSDKMIDAANELPRINTGSIFTVYQWSASGNKWVELEKFNSASTSKRYSETDDNKGVFKVIETTAPTGFQGDYTSTGTEDEDGNVTITGTSLAEYLFDVTNESSETITYLSSDDDITGEFMLNTPQYGSITVNKRTPVLTGVKTAEDGGVEFVWSQTGSAGAGAKFNVYAAQDFSATYGGEWKSGDLVDTITIGDDSTGKTSVQLPLGKYNLVEVESPADIPVNSTKIPITIEYAGQDVLVNSVTKDVDNTFAPTEVKVTKKDSWDDSTIPGAVLGLYAKEDYILNGTVIIAKDALVAKATSDSDGIATFKRTFPLGMKLYVKEITAPTNYVYSDDVVDVTIPESNPDKVATLVVEASISNDQQRGTIVSTKYDKERDTNIAQADATLEGAVYGLYAREDIKHPNGSGKTLITADTEVVTATTDNDGNFTFKNFTYNNKEEEGLFLGKYYVKEITPSTGYLLDETEYDVELSYKGQAVSLVEEKVIVKEQVIKQAFSIIKMKTDKDNTESELLEGAEFSIYLISELSKVKDGTIKANEDGTYNSSDFVGYDFTDENIATIYTDSKDGRAVNVMVTDAKGYAVSEELPYGTYVVVETKYPSDVDPVKPFIVTVTEDSREPQTYRALNDYLIETYLKIVKKDGDTKQTVLNNGASFKIFNVSKNEYVEQWIKYPKKEKVDTFTTNDEGYLITPEILKPGTYRIEEVNAPTNYNLAESLTFTIPDDDVVRVEGEDGAFYAEFAITDTPQRGNLTITKKGEKVVDYKSEDKSIKDLLKDYTVPTEETEDNVVTSDTEYKGNFIFEERGVDGAVFEIYAAEDIYTYDNQLGDDGNRTLYYKKDDRVATITTGSDGIASYEGLPIGKYYVKETTAGHGFVLNTEVKEFEITYGGQEVNFTEENVDYVNARQKLNLKVTKHSSKDDKILAKGAVYGVYAGQDIKDCDGNVLFYKGNLIRSATTDADGVLTFGDDLPLGNYFVKEITAPPGYLYSDEVFQVSGEYTTQDVEVNEIAIDAKNVPTVIQISKSDITGNEIPGASLKVTDKDGNVIDEWTSVAGESHLIEGKLTVGETYTLTEDLAPIGYTKASSVEFTISNTGEVQKVDMIDELVTGKLIVTKNGELLDSASVVEKIKGYVEYLFNWIKGSLKDVTFELYAAEDIKHPNGVSADFFKSGTKVATLTTDATGMASVENLPLGKYYLVEVKAPDGYVKVDEKIDVILEYKDQDTPVVTAEQLVENSRIKSLIQITKEDVDTEDALEGAIFGIYNKTEIENYKGESIVSPDSLVATIVTDETGLATTELLLPLGDYYVKELKAPSGYILSDDVYSFTVAYNDGDSSTSDTTPALPDNTNQEETTTETPEESTTETPEESTTVAPEETTTETPEESTTVAPEETTTETPEDDDSDDEIQPDEKFDDDDSNFDDLFDSILSTVSLQSSSADAKVVKGSTTGSTETQDDDFDIIDDFLADDGLDEDLVNDLEDNEVFDENDTSESKLTFTYTFKNDYTKVQISKQDITTGKELPGAKLTITDSKGDVVEKWTSSEKPHRFDRLPVGDYTLTEVTAPDGYLVAESIDFTVEETGDIQKVVMKDKPEDKTTPPVKTGDDRPFTVKIIAFMTMMLLGGCIIVGAKWYSKKSEDSEE